MLLNKDYKFWFCTGSQDLYGDECLAKVAQHSKQIVDELNKTGLLPYEIVWKPTLITNALIRQTAELDGMSVRIGVESVAGYKDTYTILRSLIRNRILLKIEATRDKVVRCSELEVPIANGHCHFLRGNWNAHVLAELAAFPSGAHDDNVDSIAGGFAMARKIAGSVRAV